MTRRPSGFTLLEMVVAIGIFAIIAAISYAALNNFLDARQQITARRDAIQGLQSAMILLERDMRFAVNRAVRDQYGDQEPAFFGGGEDDLQNNGEVLRLTTSRPTAGAPGSQQLTRVAWRLNDGTLSRITWRVLDRYLESPEHERVLLEDVEGFELRFLAFDENDAPDATEVWVGFDRLPAGVEVLLRLPDHGEFRRVLQVAGT